MTVEPRILPVLLLSGSQLVKTIRFLDPIYVGDPINVLSIFNDYEVDEIAIMDISAAQSRKPPHFENLRRFAEECFIPLAFGGALQTMAQLEQLFRIGYEKAILNTALAEDPGFVEDAVRSFGSQAIVASIDARKTSTGYIPCMRGGSQPVGVGDVLSYAKRAEQLGVGEIIITSIDREGTGEGYDLDLVRMVTSAVNVPVIAHGGAGSRRDLGRPIAEAGASASAAGSLFVFQKGRSGVLVNYPNRKQVERLIGL